jgi:hypothetical protein
MTYKITFAIYDDEPIACEGDDQNSGIKIEYSDSDTNIHALSQNRATEFSLQLQKYYQVWSIEKL